MASHTWLRGGPPARTAQARQAVRLQLVYSPPENQIRTDIDIIAIHGLDTSSEETWVWEPKGANVNWLKQSDMLPKTSSARIFTCDWPADLFEEPQFVQKEFEEFSRLLLAGIKSRSPVTDGGSEKAEDRPIFFIASCLGGIILMKALIMASHEYQCVQQATRGIIFLATPFRGTSFEDVARWAEPGLSTWASIRGKKISNLLELVKSSFDLGELVRSFTALCRENDLADHIAIFYETGKSSLLRKVAWLPQYLAKEKPLVDISSASLDIVKHPLPLDRPHVLMNKFSGPDDPGYNAVARKIDYLLRKIRQGLPIERADDWIRTRRYSPKELEIERLSGELLPMDRCYINLALVEHSTIHASRAVEDDASQKASPFSLFVRLKTERPDKTIEVTLPALFEPRQARDGQKRRPNRILIRGRAGVGKTTLCKKIIHDFTHAGMWKGLFDRVLWLPLRNLKRDERRSSAYNFGSLFYDEYFSQHPKGKDLAEAMWGTLAGNKTLFILDGLDEVAQDLEGDMLLFFKELLDQPNVIITSRPYATLPPRAKDVDLQLETIGFYPDQLKAYVENAFTDPRTGQTDFENVSMIQSYLQLHPLVQGLVRIPVQLDALCFTWESFKHEDSPVPRTMTAVYQAIERCLWKKDCLKLKKRTEAEALDALPHEITSSVSDERYLLEYLAFTGIYNNLIEFESKHRDAILARVKFTGSKLLDKTLKCLSFLRTSDPSLESRDQSYHFLHLTFQEYFAARYFVRQWKANEPLEYIVFGGGRNKSSKPADLDPIVFLQRNKYKSGFDIFWRFVAGLLNEEGDEEASQFFEAIETEPLDILGPMHQRLVVHCLKETQTEATFRKELEEGLFRWLLFECKYTHWSSLASEMEFPVSVLVRALRAGSEDVKVSLVDSLRWRPALEADITELLASVLEDDSFNVWPIKVLVLQLLGRGPGYSSNRVMSIIADQLEDTDWEIRQAAVESLAGQSALTPEILQKVAAKLEDEDEGVREMAASVLTSQSALKPQWGDRSSPTWHPVLWAACQPGEALVPLNCRSRSPEVVPNQPALTSDILKKVAAQLKDTDWRVRQMALGSLAGQSVLTTEILRKVAAQLEDTNWRVRQAAVKVLAGQSELTPEILEKVAVLLAERSKNVRWAVAQLLLKLAPATLEKVAARLSDRSKNMRSAATRIVFTDLVQGILKAAAAQLEDRDRAVRLAALEALANQSALSSDILLKVIARLEDYGFVREEAVKVLARQSAPTPEILKEVAARLEHQDETVRWAAARVFIDLAPSTDRIGPHLYPLYQALLERSFKGHVGWFNAGGFSYVIVGERQVSLGGFSCQLMEAIRATQRALGSPLSN